MKTALLRAIPSVEKVLQAIGKVDLPRPAVVAIVRRELKILRSNGKVPDFEGVLIKIKKTLHVLQQSRIQPVLNGTGILIHTNLGRAPLSLAAIETLREIGSAYNNLEYDLANGERGGRAAYLEHNLALLCGAEAATVVNNNAAALILILRHFIGKRSEVIISRGELIQIGGGFRIPEILETSGARLREIGTTNKTFLRDYARAINRQTALILKVHRSNFFMGGFVESPLPEEIAALAKKRRIPFIEDLGSGAVIQTEKISGLEHEPTPAEVLQHGADLVCFSGDKLLGGPQAGMIAGKARFVKALKQESFYRALRCDKLILSALQTTVDLYLENLAQAVPAAQKTVPVLAMLNVSNNDLRARSEKIISAFGDLPLKATTGTGKSQIGGGTLPHSHISSVTLDLAPQNMPLPEFAARLREGSPPIIGYIERSFLKLDLRTILPEQDEKLVCAIREVF